MKNVRINKINIIFGVILSLFCILGTIFFFHSPKTLYAEEAEVVEFGSKQHPYVINDEADLLKYVKLINDESDTNKYNEKYYILNNDITLSKVKLNNETYEDLFWTPIGTGNRPFKGNFDGNGFVIRNVRLNQTDSSGYVTSGYLGLFGNCKNATITKLGVEIAENYYLNEVYDDTDINNVSNYTNYENHMEEGFVVEKNLITSNLLQFVNVGGLVGKAVECDINNCYAYFDYFKISTNSSCYVGGLVGYCESSKIINCYTDSTLKDINIYLNNISKSANISSIGAIIGYCDNVELTNCYSNVSIYANSAVVRQDSAEKMFLYAGGVCGYVKGINAYISNSFVLKNVGGNSIDGALNKGALFGFIDGSYYNKPSNSNINYIYYHCSNTVNARNLISLLGTLCTFEISDTCKALENSELLAYESFKNLKFNIYNKWDNDIVWTKTISNTTNLKLQCFHNYSFSVAMNNSQLKYGFYEVYIDNEKQNISSFILNNFTEKAGKIIKIVPINNVNYKFSFWQFNGVIISNDVFSVTSEGLEFTLGELTAGRIEAFFSAVQYPITIMSDGNGKVKVDAVTVKESTIYRSYGSSFVLSAEPNAGYILNKWTDENGNTIDNKKEITVNVTGPVTLKANFTSNVYYVDCKFNDGGFYYLNDIKVTQNDKIMFNKNEKITLKTDVFDGYEFKGFYEGERLITNETDYTFTLTGDLQIEAKFEAIAEKNKNKVNWGLIFGIIGGVLVVGGGLTVLIILKVRKNRMRNLFGI